MNNLDGTFKISTLDFIQESAFENVQNIGHFAEVTILWYDTRLFANSRCLMSEAWTFSYNNYLVKNNFNTVGVWYACCWGNPDKADANIYGTYDLLPMLTYSTTNTIATKVIFSFGIKSHI